MYVCMTHSVLELSLECAGRNIGQVCMIEGTEVSYLDLFPHIYVSFHILTHRALRCGPYSTPVGLFVFLFSLFSFR